MDFFELDLSKTGSVKDWICPRLDLDVQGWIWKSKTGFVRNYIIFKVLWQLAFPTDKSYFITLKYQVRTWLTPVVRCVIRGKRKEKYESGKNLSQSLWNLAAFSNSVLETCFCEKAFLFFNEFIFTIFYI